MNSANDANDQNSPKTLIYLHDIINDLHTCIGQFSNLEGMSGTFCALQICILCMFSRSAPLIFAPSTIKKLTRKKRLNNPALQQGNPVTYQSNVMFQRNCKG